MRCFISSCYHDSNLPSELLGLDEYQDGLIPIFSNDTLILRHVVEPVSLRGYLKEHQYPPSELLIISIADQHVIWY